MLSFDLTITGSGTFSIRATDGQNTFRVVLQPEHNRFAVHQNDTPLKVGDDNIAVREGMRIEVSLVDRQFLLAFDGREVVKCPLAEATGDPRGTTEPFAVGAEAVSVVVSNSRIVRDIYYSDPIGKLPYGWGGSPATLGSDSYYVLGDNSPISEDSRTWGRTSQIVSNSLLGKPLAVIFPAQSCQPFGRRFQIPDLRRIRYIR
jgi:signal peptidase I